MILHDTKHYTVELSDGLEIIDETGKYSNRPGYVVINKETSIIEVTAMMLPQAIYQAQGLSDSLDALTKADETPNNLVSMVTEDVVPH